MSRFFIDTPLSTTLIGQSITLPDGVYHHWCKVLRAKVGDTAVLFDGTGGEYTAELISIDKKSAQAIIHAYDPINRTPPFAVSIGLVMSRGDRMDYAIQKACEMGVHQIQLLTSERCQAHLKYERDFKKIEHWQGVAIAACEQCGLNIIPKIIPPVALETWVADCTANLKLVLALSDGKPSFTSPLPDTIALLIGAEGGLSPTEIDFAIEHGFVPWTIGERVLRTETAPVVALTALHMIHELG
ncbi:16S rRNA (uracil(1498)-N(3))-methyltransferase [Moraxella sp. FZLJ2107]|uniref:16S rRNA (uracil(1498)-N(3))-methyltransferase n=1 Tax=unclassified Moraxella TaxID=2685852 RepID=UPI0020C880A2|nr:MULTISPECIES: 16S rRNA (uracil(1498)-N(3))-methyltransferase [unclassified Moraxella]UTO05734.1 16S rRNA (uracil(1498)-N(3))-methyltransferase [Moraxella sp. FZLJ2107]UTO22470.1 16S rRNA (uracil(1498)-N(3))-methyltransferase [Moraxella sp. FZLJ2109]